MYDEWNRPCKRLVRAGRKKLTEVEILFSVKVKDFEKQDYKFTPFFKCHVWCSVKKHDQYEKQKQRD